MNYDITIIKSKEEAKRKVLIIYTGGTFGMRKNEQGALEPCPFTEIETLVPELYHLGVDIQINAFRTPMDSSDVDHTCWIELATTIETNYELFDGFVILHGTDTMSFSASALSFLVQGLQKAVIFTGAQLPMGSLRSDAKRNLISAIQIAADYTNGTATVKEVALCFNTELHRGNRSKKLESTHFKGFHSENYPTLAQIGSNIDYNYTALLNGSNLLTLFTKMDAAVGVLKVFPGITKVYVENVLLKSELSGVVIESFGSGNVMKTDWLLKTIAEAINKGIVVTNVSQCLEGKVVHGKYAVSRELEAIGVISGGDMTFEAMYTKLKFVLSNYQGTLVKDKILTPIVGERSV